jgi:site-specific DNA recombinase
MNMMRVAIYIRVSTEEQAQEGYSIAAQRARLEAYAISQGWEIIYYYIDEGLSAKDMNRTELQRMLKGVEEGVFDIVLVYKLDRLTRSVLDLYQLLETFDKYNVKFKSATEVYDTTSAIGRLFITLVAALAQWERENLGERVSFGMQQKAKEGKWTVSTPPFGFNLNDSVLLINQGEAAIVKEIFSLYISGMGMWKIASILNEHGLKTRRNKQWGQNSIHYILKNPIYKGTTRYNYRVNKDQYFERDEVAPEIISEEEFRLTQQMMEQRKSVHPRQATSKFIFSKVLKCSRCGSTLIGKTSTSKRETKKYISQNYICQNKLRGTCDLPSISERLFEQKFLELMDTWDFKEAANELMNDEVTASIEDVEITVKELKEELKNIENRRSKWQYAWVNEMFSKDEEKNNNEFKKRMHEEDEKEKMILKELNELTPQESPLADSSILDYWTELKKNWKDMDDQMKKQFILIAVNYIVVDKSNKVRTPDAIEIKDWKFN